MFFIESEIETETVTNLKLFVSIWVEWEEIHEKKTSKMKQMSN